MKKESKLLSNIQSQTGRNPFVDFARSINISGLHLYSGGSTKEQTELYSGLFLLNIYQTSLSDIRQARNG